MKKLQDSNYKGAFFTLLWILSLFGCIGWIIGVIQEKKPYYVIFIILIIFFNIWFFKLCNKHDKKRGE